MKKILFIIILINLSGCAALDSSGKCYYAEVPSKFLTNEKGQYIDTQGKITSQKSINPDYQLYLKCNNLKESSNLIPTSISTLGTIKDQLSDNYLINGKQYTLTGERKIRPGGGYIQSFFASLDNQSLLQQEIFTYNGPKPFYGRFLKDINEKEGKFELKHTNGINYIIGKNNHNYYVIYIVKDILNNEVSIVQLMFKEPFNNVDIPLLVKDLNNV